MRERKGQREGRRRKPLQEEEHRGKEEDQDRGGDPRDTGRATFLRRFLDAREWQIGRLPQVALEASISAKISQNSSPSLNM